MEKINGKQVVRIGILAEDDELSQLFIKALVKAYDKELNDFTTPAATVHGNLKVFYKEIDVETEKYYYKIIFLKDDGGRTGVESVNDNRLKVLIANAAKPDVLLIAINQDPSRNDRQFFEFASMLRLPIAGMFIHARTPRDPQEQIDWELLEGQVQEVINYFQYYSTPDHFGYGDLQLAVARGELETIKRFMDEVSSSMQSHLESAKNDRRDNGPVNTKKIETYVFKRGKKEGFKKPILDGQVVTLDFAGKKFQGKVGELHGEKYTDWRNDRKDYAAVRYMTLSFDDAEKIGIGDRFLITVDGEIDGIGVVKRVHYM